LLAIESITLVVQVDGRVRDRLTVPAEITEAEAREQALRCERARQHVDGRHIERVVYVPGRLVNIVTRR
jgi:leucyl-tRNA synthetase